MKKAISELKIFKAQKINALIYISSETTDKMYPVTNSRGPHGATNGVGN